MSNLQSQNPGVLPRINMPLPVASIGVLLLLIGGVANAGESSTANTGAYNLDEIIVTASRRAENAFSSPYSVVTQDMQALQEVRQVRTLPDAMREMSGVMVQKTAYGQGSPYIRGFTGLRTLFLIDGIRLNNSTFREGPNQYWSTVDPLSVYRLEVVKGPSSVLYGSDAIGGTVNAISRSYGDLSQTGGLQTRLSLRGASAEQSLIARPEVGYRNGSVEVIGGVSIKNFGDLRTGGDTGEQPMTGYNERGGDLKIDIDLGENRALVLAVQHNDQDDAWRTHKTIFGTHWRGTTSGDELQRSLDQQRTLAYAQFKAGNLASRENDLTLSISWHQQKEDQLRVRNDGRFDEQGTDVGTFGLWGQLDLPSQTGLWTVGAELYHDDVDSYRTDYNADGSLRSVSIQGPVADDSIYVTAAAFLQNHYAFGDKGELTSGLRYTWTDLDAKAVQDPATGERIAMSDNWKDLTASVRFSRPLGQLEKARWFAGISQGFRAPNLSDLTRFDTARSNEFEIPVANLDAEEFVSYELGIKIDGSRWNSQIALFYTDIDDLIIRVPTGRIIDGENEITKRNSGKGYAKGIELQGRFNVSEAWALFGNLTLLDGEVDGYPDINAAPVPEPLDRLMPVTAYLGARWQPVTARFWVEGLLNIADQQDNLSSRDLQDTDRIPPGGTPGYTNLTLRGGWQFSDQLRLSLAMDNILDEDYRNHGSGVNEPGRNLVLSVFWNN